MENVPKCNPGFDVPPREVVFSDAGQYTCFAENRFGSEEARGSLTVKQKTRITHKPVNYEVKAGDQAVFRWVFFLYLNHLFQI